MSFLQHPAFQSLVLPLLLAVAGIALLHTVGARWKSLGAGLALVIALAFWPGFEWPASSRAQTIPWIALAGLVGAALVLGLNAPGSRVVGRAAGVLATAMVAALAGALALWAALGGSLLLAQLALMVASVAGVASVWAWRRATVTPASLLPLLLAGLAIAHALASLAPAAPQGGDDAAGQDDPYYTPKWK